MNRQQLLFATLSTCFMISQLASCTSTSTPRTADGGKLRVLIVDGFNPYHDWQVTTPLMKRILERSGRFTVDVATVPVPADYKCSPSAQPAAVEDLDFHPRFADYDVIVGNYIGPRWPAETEQEFVDFVANGGGFVAVHSANNTFPDWQEYNRICGLGGWYGRDEKWGPYVYYKGDELVRDTSPGGSGHHGPKYEYQVRIRDAEHPVTQGLPPLWMHAKDELYDTLRGPAENLHVLATAYSDPEFEGTGRDEPMLMTVDYGKGRVFNTALGHNEAMKCVGFATTLLRGTEWAATGKVTIPVPDDFPTAEKSSTRDF